MKLEEIQSLWGEDSNINRENLDQESTRIPKLHHKYITILSDERRAFKYLLDKRKQLEMTLQDYYTGKIDGRDIGREPWPVKEIKEYVTKRVECDKEMVDMNLKLVTQEEKVLYLKEVILNINQRNYQIKNAIDWVKWTGGAL